MGTSRKSVLILHIYTLLKYGCVIRIHYNVESREIAFIGTNQHTDNITVFKILAKVKFA